MMTDNTESCVVRMMYVGTALMAAAREGDAVAVLELLAAGAKAGALRDKRGRTALCHATEAGQTQCVQILRAAAEQS